MVDAFIHGCDDHRANDKLRKLSSDDDDAMEML